MDDSLAQLNRTTDHEPAGYETFLWLELIGFDNTQPDMGVRAYLNDLGFIPTGLSIFMWGPDFVHQHAGLAQDAEFPPDIGAYLDVFTFQKKQPGPAWTRYQLRTLIKEFHKFGVKVNFSIFPNSLGDRFHKEWLTQNPEVEVIPLEDYTPWFPMLHPLKRLRDGSFYEDFFVTKIVEVAQDYGFDGIHLVDGFNHGWYQLHDAEYSDDMVDQFTAWSGVQLPAEHPAQIGLNKPELKKRAHWIWQNRRRQWIDFHVQRWETFFRKVVNAMHGAGKEVAANTCWTRDPLESIYRYGIDYRRIAATGVDRFVIETCGAGGEMLNRVCRARFSVPFFHVIKATSLMTRVAVPEMKIVFNNCTQDITEGWSIVRHAPAFLEREIFSYSNLYHIQSDGRPRRVFDGLNVCLAAGMEKEEWQFVHDRWKLAFDAKPACIDGLTLVYSEQAFNRELDAYLKSRGNTAYNVLYHLSAKGVPIAATVNIDDIDKVRGPVLVVNPHLYPEGELDRVFHNRTSPVVMIGPKLAGPHQPDVQFADVGGPDELKFFLFNADVQQTIVIPPATVDAVPEDENTIAEAPSFFDEQYYRPVSDGFYAACAEAIEAAIKPALRVDLADFPYGEWVGIQTFALADGRQRCFIWNDEFRYVDTRVAADRTIEKVDMVSNFRGRPIRTFDDEADTWTTGQTSGRRFIVRIPPKGIGVVDLHFGK